MTRSLFLAGAALIASPAMAQSWDAGPKAVSWVDNPQIGEQLDTHPEIFTSTQGGDPPALAYEPATVDEVGYTRSDWIVTGSNGVNGVDRYDAGEAKFRITCEFSWFAMIDPIIAYGGTSPHHHTGFGPQPTSTSNYTSLRNANVKSTCSGGPLNKTAYWEPSWLREFPKDGVISGGETLINPGVTQANEAVVHAPAKPNVVSFYYTDNYSNVTKLTRFFKGQTVILGVDPSDRLNTARLAEIPDGQGWDKTKRYNGWVGWQCFNKTLGTNVNAAGGSTADINPESGFPRQWLNADGTDPWAGACEGPNFLLIANVVAPTCWDGRNLKSPNGRNQWRYTIVKSAAQNDKKCPDTWFVNSHLEVKTEFPALTHAKRRRSYLSSDRMDPNPANWHPNGSTFHADWMMGWDFNVMLNWGKNCAGWTINGVAGTPLTCGNSTISATERMLVGENAPNSALANSPVVTARDFGTGPTKNAVGKLLNPSEVRAVVTHAH